MFLVRDLGAFGAFAPRIAKPRGPGGRLVPRRKTWRLDGSTRFGVESLYRFVGVSCSYVLVERIDVGCLVS